jgi:DNA-binding NarL/FixJ family response regulator
MAPMAMERRVAVASEQELLRLGVGAALSRRRDLSFVGSCAHEHDIDALLKSKRPTVLMLDSPMLASGPLGLARFARLWPQLKIVLLWSEADKPDVLQSLRAGAVGLLSKMAQADALARCVHAVANGEFWIDRGSFANIVGAVRAGRSRKRSQSGIQLTERQQQVLEALLEGGTNQEIANRLGVAEQTVKNHMGRLFTTLRARNRVELAMRARNSLH